MQSQSKSQNNKKYYFVNINKLILVFIQREYKRLPEESMQYLRRRIKLGDRHSKAHSRAILSKTVWYWQKNEPIDQRDGIEVPEIDPLNTISLCLTRE